MQQRMRKETNNDTHATGRARELYARVTVRAAVILTTAIPCAVQAGAAKIAAALERRRAAIRIAALFCVLAGLALLVPDIARAQGGAINPDAGADKIFDVLGLIALLAGIVMAIGQLFARRIMAALGYGLGGGLIWAFCSNPEGTIGGAAEWLIQQFQGGGG